MVTCILHSLYSSTRTKFLTLIHVRYTKAVQLRYISEHTTVLVLNLPSSNDHVYYDFINTVLV